MATIPGTNGTDDLVGTGGDDEFYPGFGFDRITGAGRQFVDEVNYSDLAQGRLSVSFGRDYESYLRNEPGSVSIDRTFVVPGNIVVFIETQSLFGINAAIGTSRFDIFSGGYGFQRFAGLRGTDVYSGWDGLEQVDYSRDASYGGTTGYDGTGAIYADLRSGRVVDGFGDRDTLFNIGSVVGTAFNDLMVGGDAPVVLYGGDGNDTINGGLGYDTLVGDAGNDTLYGGGTADIFHGGAGNDALNGGVGADTMYGEAGADSLFGGEGSDTLSGGDGADHLIAGNGDNSLYGDAGADSLHDGDGNGYLVGGSGDDGMFGGGGTDQFFSGAGSDWMVGGMGADLFVFATGDGADTIVDFNVLEDRINLGAVPGLDSFTEVQARMSFNGVNTVIDLGGGNTVTIVDVRPEQLTDGQFHI